ncbi:MAG: ATP-binding protein [Pelobium sp.]
MVKHFSPSQNILLNNFDVSQYTITPNVQEVFEAIVSNYASGLRSINLIGAYGTGKSTFLNALTYHLNEEKVFVEGKDWRKYKRFEILKLVGNYDSIIDNVKDLIGSSSVKPVALVKDLEVLIKAANAQGRGFILMIDEFGKFLEYASANGAEKELYFLQQIAELINNAEYEAAFVTTLHQDFSAYAVQLNSTQRNEWIKVKGRFKELTFNEPVEQLLLLASKRIEATPDEAKQQQITQLIQIIGDAKAFSLKDYFDQKIANKIYPLDLLSGSVLALALQQYGQNERSLFTFLNTDNFYGLHEFNEERQHFYAIANVYDYLNYNLYSFLNSKANIHYNKWAEIKNALERIEGEVDEKDHILYQTLIKTIGLLNIFSHAGAKLDKEFLVKYLELTGKLKGVAEAIENLQRKNLLSYNKYSHRFFYSETTVVNIDDAIKEAGLEISRANNIVSFLNSYFPLAPVAAKRAYYEKGTPRVFEYKITDAPYAASTPSGQVDGFINLIFNEQVKASTILEASQHNPDAILYAHFLRVEDIQHAIEEIEKAEIAKAKYPNDKIINRELSAIIEIQKSLLNYYLYEGFYDWDAVKWYFRGEERTFLNSKQFNAFLSEISDEIYPLTPIFISELANKSKLSGTISSARRLLIEAILSAENEEVLGIDGFPPQKSIYLSLLLQTGIHQKTADGWALQEITNPAQDRNQFIPLFQTCNDFIATTRGAKRSVADLYELLEQAPFKLKRGFLDFWIPIYLLIKTDDFALYGMHGFIPEIDAEVLELLVKNPSQYSVKAFDTEGIKVKLFNEYRHLLALGDEDHTSNEAFIKTIVPFIKFYKELKPYAKNTKQLSKKTLKVRKALTEATDPEKLFFEDFPEALGYDTVQLTKTPELLTAFSADLQNAIRELRSAYDELLNKFEGIINFLWNKDYTFALYKEQFRQRFETSLKKYLLLPYQKTFYDRLCSPLEDRGAWLSSVAQATIGKTLDTISDQEVEQLQERFLNLVRELDNLNEMALEKVNLEEEHVYKLEITIPGESIKPQTIRLPKKEDSRLAALENDLSLLLEKEGKSFKIAILANLLKKEIEQNGK